MADNDEGDLVKVLCAQEVVRRKKGQRYYRMVKIKVLVEGKDWECSLLVTAPDQVWKDNAQSDQWFAFVDRRAELAGARFRILLNRDCWKQARNERGERSYIDHDYSWEHICALPRTDEPFADVTTRAYVWLLNRDETAVLLVENRNSVWGKSFAFKLQEAFLEGVVAQMLDDGQLKLEKLSEEELEMLRDQEFAGWPVSCKKDDDIQFKEWVGGEHHADLTDLWDMISVEAAKVLDEIDDHPAAARGPPGGAMGGGEKEFAAAKRELKEETGISWRRNFQIEGNILVSAEFGGCLERHYLVRSELNFEQLPSERWDDNFTRRLFSLAIEGDWDVLDDRARGALAELRKFMW